MFAALAGVLAFVGAASAQAPASQPIPQPLPIGTARLQQAVSPAYVAGAPVTLAGHQTYVRGSGGCNGCGTPAPCATGNNCNNGCGSAKANCGFMFGSCKSFFNACGPLSGGHGGKGGHGHGGRGGHCGTLPLGTPYGTGANMCHYDSFLNH